MSRATPLPDSGTCLEQGMPLPEELAAMIQGLEFVDLRELAENEPSSLWSSKIRGASRQAVVVLVISCLKTQLENKGGGIQVFQGQAYIYDRTYWRVIDRELLLQFLIAAAERLGVPRVDARHYQFGEDLSKQFFAAAGRSLRQASELLINFRNGTLKLSPHGEHLRHFERSDFLTYQLPFDYDPKASCPAFMRFLNRVLPELEKQRALSEFFGWVFVRDLKLEKMLILHGTGQNGKSVIFDVMVALYGGDANITTYSLATLDKLENRVAIGGKLLNFASEISGRVDPDLLKKIASGEPLEARNLYEAPFIMTDYARLAFNANTLPRVTEQTQGYFRRFLIIRFEEIISDAEKNPDLARQIIACELPGVFNWVLAGLRRVRSARGFSPCASADAAVRQYQREDDSTALFMDEHGLVPDANARYPKGDLYGDYRNFCGECGYRPLNKNDFGKRFKDVHRIEEGKSNGRRYWKMNRSET